MAERHQARPELWLDQYGDLLYQYALTRVGDPAVGEDLVQDTFLSALKALGGYKGEASEKNWLFSILKHKIIDHYRKKTTVALTETDGDGGDEPWFDSNGNWAAGNMPGDWVPGDSLAERKELRAIIAWCRDHLRELQQQVFSLRYLEDMPAAEICKVLNISSSNYWVILHRVRLHMRNCVEHKWIKS